MPALPVRNPRTGLYDYQIEPATPADLATISARLRAAQPAWEALGPSGRAEVLREWAAVIRRQRDALLQTLIVDTGRVWASGAEIDGVLTNLERWATVAPQMLEPVPPRRASIPFLEISSQFVPYPLVGVIAPWNFPLLLSLLDAIPALAAGCAVIIKPSEVAPRFVDPLRQTLAAVPALEPVVAFVQGAGETGAALIEVVDCVCFTGSVATGRKVAEAAARRFIPAYLELGGKDPTIVLASADLDQASSGIVWGATANTGQSCQSVERVYVQRPVFEEFVRLVVAKAEQVRLAYPDPNDGELGPIIFERQAAILEEHLRDACARGARILTGGQIERLGGGLWLRPTVLVDLTHAMKVMREESFGPIIPLMPFDTVEEAIALANDSDYGLSANVFAGSREEGEAIARRLQAGLVSVNDVCLSAFVHEAENEPFRFSGLGRSRMGPTAVLRYGRPKAIVTNVPAMKSPWWYDGGERH